ncbi:MAG: homoserine dehydrogenase [Thermoplasmata archaeon]|nr:homoserine dehydrogenase [Thermoplasmata archaeon]
MEFRLGFAGFGVVARGLCEILIEKREMLQELYGLEWKVVAISDFRLGSIADGNGIDIESVLETLKNGGRIDNVDAPVKGWDVPTMIKNSNANTLVEVTYTDVKTGEPAMTYIKAALDNGMHVVSTNKGPVVKAIKELRELAEANGVRYGVEGVVLSGTPVLNLVEYTLAGNRISEVKGMVNGTTNYILTKMEEGMGYKEALEKAQELGYAEADPTGDVEGWDALGKVVILTNLIFGKSLRWEDVEREGITKISAEDIKSAQEEGMRWKLIGSAKLLPDGTVKASVKPKKLPLSDPLAGIPGATNALTFVTDELGPVTIIGPGAGKRETGYSLLIELINICRFS